MSLNRYNITIDWLPNGHIQIYSESSIPIYSIRGICLMFLAKIAHIFLYQKHNHSRNTETIWYQYNYSTSLKNKQTTSYTKCDWDFGSRLNIFHWFLTLLTLICGEVKCFKALCCCPVLI